MKKIIHFLNYNAATCFGAGLSPIAPGTVGSLVCVVAVWLFFPANVMLQLLVAVALTAMSIYSGGWLAEAEGDKDPSMVVSDELAGQWITFLMLPLGAVGSYKVLIAGFLLFRIFDIWKPWPANRLEKMPGGWGITLDDVAAGVYANIVLQLWLRFF